MANACTTLRTGEVQKEYKNVIKSQCRSRVVHLRNIPSDMTDVELIHLCIPFGKVTNFLLLKGKNQVRCSGRKTNVDTVYALACDFCNSAPVVKTNPCREREIPIHTRDRASLLGIRRVRRRDRRHGAGRRQQHMSYRSTRAHDLLSVQQSPRAENRQQERLQRHFGECGRSEYWVSLRQLHSALRISHLSASIHA